MFEDLSKLAKVALENALKKAEEVAKANPEIIEAIKGGAQLVADKKGENKGVIENAKENLKDKTIQVTQNPLNNISPSQTDNQTSIIEKPVEELSYFESALNLAKEYIGVGVDYAKDNLKEKAVNAIQEAINNISPLKIDIKGSITEKSIVITEESLNTFLREKITDIDDLQDIDIKIWDDNLLFITGKASKNLIKFSFHQKLKLEEFVMNNKKGTVRFSLIGEPDIQGKGFISHVALFITRMILMSVVNKKLVGIMNENNFELKENKLIIDLKNGAAKKLYEMDINSASGKNIPVIGSQKVIDLIKIKDVTTKDKKIMIDLGFDFKNYF